MGRAAGTLPTLVFVHWVWPRNASATYRHGGTASDLQTAQGLENGVKINSLSVYDTGLPRWCSGKESACQTGATRDAGSIPGLGRFPWRRKWQPTAAFFPGKCHGHRGLAGCKSTGLPRIGHAWSNSTGPPRILDHPLRAWAPSSSPSVKQTQEPCFPNSLQVDLYLWFESPSYFYDC